MVLIRFFGKGSSKARSEFYDVHNDPEQLHNLVGSAQYTEVEKKLAAILKQWQQETYSVRKTLAAKSKAAAAEASLAEQKAAASEKAAPEP